MDPFYDTLDETAADRVVRRAGQTSLFVGRLGTSIFWMLVIAIMSARVFLFSPDVFAALH